MRKYIDIVNESIVDEESPVDMQCHRAGTTMIIDNMEVNRDQRGKGIGAIFYRDWEARLPNDIDLVRLWATGYEVAQFWEKMGFEFQYTADEMIRDDFDDDIWQWMWKGVNDNPTPPVVILTQDDN